jgi:hypothetical protein
MIQLLVIGKTQTKLPYALILPHLSVFGKSTISIIYPTFEQNLIKTK